MLEADSLTASDWISLLLGLVTIYFLFWYSRRNHDYWQKRNIPFVKPLPFVGNVYSMFRNAFHEVELKRYNELGKVYGHYECNTPLLSVADPEHLRNILVKDFASFSSRRNLATGNKVFDNNMSVLIGEDWKRIRTIVTPTFTTGKIRKMLGIFEECSKTLVQNFSQLTKEGEEVDAKKVYGAFTMDVIASSAFSTKLDSHNDPENEFVKMARKVFFISTVNWRLVLFLLAPSLMRLLKIPVVSSSTMDFFSNVTRQIIQERRKTGQKRNDFLQLLLDTASEEKIVLEKESVDISDNYGEEGGRLSTFENAPYKRNLTMDELVSQCVIFFLAGYDATASTLAFASYELAINQDVQEKVRAEVDQILQESNGELTYEAIQKMKYLDNVISETLRLYPPPIRLERLAQEDYKLGNTGITIPKGMVITVPLYAIHRDPNNFKDPEQFDPERFRPEERAKRDPYTFLPFGAGPRNCVGVRFALVKVKVCLVHVISAFKIKKSPKTKVPLEFNCGQGLLQPKEICIAFEERNDGQLRE